MAYEGPRKFVSEKFMRVGLAVFAAALVLSPAAVFAKSAGDLVIRFRALGVVPDEGGAGNDGAALVGGDTKLTSDIVPELDFTYFFTDNIAAELILATTQHTASLTGSTLGNLDLGTVRLLPPTLNLQYHFLPKGKISPYIGAGLNYTIFFDARGGRGNGAGTVVNDISYSNGFGYSFQAGVDWQIDDKWHLNADVKKIFLNTDINVNNGTIKVDDADVDPWIFGVGVGYTF